LCPPSTKNCFLFGGRPDSCQRMPGTTIRGRGLSLRRRGWGARGTAGYGARVGVFWRCSFVFPTNGAVFYVFDNDTRVCKLFANFIGAFEIAAFLGGLALFHGSSELCGREARLRRAEAELGEPFGSVGIEYSENLIEFLHCRDGSRGIL